MIRIALMKWEEGRLMSEEANGTSPVLPPSVFLIYPGRVYSLMNENLLLKKKISPPSVEQRQCESFHIKKLYKHWFLPSKALHLPSCGLCTSQDCLQPCPPPQPPVEKTPPVFPLHNKAHSAPRAQVKSQEPCVPK